MAERYLHHVTLTTGHARRSYRREVTDQAVAVCAELIARAMGGRAAEPVPIPGVGDYHLTGRAGGRCLVANVWPGRPAPMLNEPSLPAPLVTIGIAAHSACGARLWRILHQHGETPVVTDPARCPPEPWVAVAIDAGLAHHPEAAHWLGDFERCLGWAWIGAIRESAWCRRCEMRVMPREDRGDSLCPRCGLVL